MEQHADSSEPHKHILDDGERIEGSAEHLSDAAYLLARRKRTLLPAEESVVEQQPDAAAADGIDSPVSSALATIKASGRLFLRNLPFAASIDDVTNLFQPFGSVTAVSFPRSVPNSSLNAGLGYVTFEDPECAVAAYQTVDGQPFMGRLLHVLPAVELKPQRPQQGPFDRPLSTNGKRSNALYLNVSVEAIKGVC